MLFLLPAPAEQTQSGEAGGEERECSRKWRLRYDRIVTNTGAEIDAFGQQVPTLEQLMYDKQLLSFLISA